MSYNIEQRISPLLQEQFPEFYKQEGNNFIAFVKAYYEWMEQSGYAENASRNVLNYKDVDNTITAFADNFRKEFLSGVPALVAANNVHLVKHIQDLYKSKGSNQSVQLLFRLLYDEDIQIYTPKDDILRASDGNWVIPYYLEVDAIDRARTFVGKQIRGSISGATAFVESVTQKRAGGKFINVIYISDIAGNFQTGEQITNDNLLTNAPRITGSLTNIKVTNGGANNKIGDIFNIYSNTINQSSGLYGTAKVTAVVDGTGKVTFTLSSGGSGYTSSANVYVSNTVLFYSGLTNSNAAIQTFGQLETIKQPLATFQYISAAGLTGNAFSVGANVTGYYANNTASGNGYVVTSNKVSNTNGTIVISVVNGSFSNSATAYVTLAGTLNANAQTAGNTYDISATGLLIGSNTSSATSGAMGLYALSNTFIIGGQLIGQTSNTVANLVIISTGSGANFNIGTLNVSESLSLFTDMTGSNNSVNVPYMNLRLDGTNSNVNHISGTGTITLNTATQSVTGTGTAFLAELAALNFSNGGIASCNTTNATVTGTSSLFGSIYPGYILYVTSNAAIIGTVSSVANATSLQLTSNAAYLLTANNITYSKNNIVPVGLYAAANGLYLGTVNTVLSNTSLNLTSAGLANVSSINFQYGYGSYGFPKNTVAGLYNTLSDVLSVGNFTLGSIASLSGINPGSNYNANPFVLVRDNLIAGYNRRYFTLSVNNSTGVFNTGDTLQQQLGLAGISFSLGTIAGTTSNGTITANTATNVVTGVSTTFAANIASGYSVYGANVLLGTVATVANNTSLTLTSNSAANVVGSSIQFSYGSTFANGEAIYQPATNAYGTIAGITGSTYTITNVINTFSNTSAVYGLATKFTANITSTISTLSVPVSVFQKGKIISANSTTLYVQRTLFNTAFSPGIAITDSNTSASATIVSVNQDQNSPLMGNNGTVYANVTTSTGIATAVQVYTSGYGYDQTTTTWIPNVAYNANDKVIYKGNYYIALQPVPYTTSSPDISTSYWSQYSDLTLYGVTNSGAQVIQGNALVQRQGVGAGYWTDNRGKLNSDKYIHDNKYYQEYSYEIRSSKSLDRYSDVLKKLVHVAGTQLFGNVVTGSSISIGASAPGASVYRSNYPPLIDFQFANNSGYAVIIPL
jgi:hypothetical protein